jgi:chromate transporter
MDLKLTGALFLSFARVGVMTFGGGYAMLPMLQREIVEKRGWATEEELADYFAIGQCTPGIIAMNVSTFIGEKRKGVKGAIAASAGFLTGPVILILIIAMFISRFAELEVVQHAFAGIRVCVCVLILEAVLKLWKKSVVDKFSLGLYIVIFALAVLSRFLPFSVPAAVLVIASGVLGFFFCRDEGTLNDKRKKG